MSNTVLFADGKLNGYREKIIEHLINGVDAELHAQTYKGCNGNEMYAEPEFTGKYLDLCVSIYKKTGSKKALDNARKVVESIIENQRADGYIGCLPDGKEMLNFGVWNQAFTVLGLISYYKETGDTSALEAAEKSVTYTMEYFLSGKGDILDSLNDGTQHISILYFICKLYRVDSKEQFKKYILFIVDTIRKSDLNYFACADILSLRSRKGIETFIILLGLTEYAEIFNDDSAWTAVENYWQQVNDTQIRNTGNGTINEFWTENGSGCMLLGNDIKANETCVAVGWIELSLTLFFHTASAKYLDAVDKTLFNHILASVSEDGTDFAYYQPNYGKMIKTKEAALYKCCRYRGFTLFTYLDEMFCYENEREIIPIIYMSGSYKSTDTSLDIKTDYPFNPNLNVKVKSVVGKTLKLRVPENCKAVSLEINGDTKEITVECGYICVPLKADCELNIVLNLENVLTREYGVIDEKEYISFTLGCILLVANQIEDNTIILKRDTEFKQIENNRENSNHFYAEDINGNKVEYCGYADADNFSTWMQIK